LHEKCPGYRDEWELIFRDQTNHTIERAKEKVMKRASHGAQLSHAFVYCSDKIQPNSSFKSMDRPRRLSLPQTSGLSQSIAPGAMVGSQLFASYLNDYFPRKARPTCPLDMSYVIISGIYTLPQKSLMLEKASSALSCVFLGKLHQDKPLLQYGLWLYNQAIQDMSRALSRKPYNDDIVYTCTLFGQIEVSSVPPSLDA
jgi:hypothetical protein